MGHGKFLERRNLSMEIAMLVIAALTLLASVVIPILIPFFTERKENNTGPPTKENYTENESELPEEEPASQDKEQEPYHVHHH